MQRASLPRRQACLVCGQAIPFPKAQKGRCLTRVPGKVVFQKFLGSRPKLPSFLGQQRIGAEKEGPGEVGSKSVTSLKSVISHVVSKRV